MEISRVGPETCGFLYFDRIYSNLNAFMLVNSVTKKIMELYQPGHDQLLIVS